jgi:hypothetical protein
VFFSRPTWDDYRQDILAFCGELGRQPWVPSKPAREFLLAVQRGYHRVGLAGAPDGWRAIAAACLWHACVHPDAIQFVMAGTMKSGHAWVRYLKQTAAESHDMIREHLLFTEDDSAILVRNADSAVLAVLSPGHLVGASKIQHGRPTILVMPDLDRVPTKWLPVLQSFVHGQHDQWLTVAPVSR